MQRLRRLHDPRPVVPAHTGRPHPVPRDARLPAQEPHADLPPGHLQREQRRGHGGRSRLVDGDVANEVGHERGLADAGPRRHDDEVALLEAGEELVQVAETAGDPAVRRLALVDVLELLHGLVDERTDQDDLVLLVPAGHRVDELLGPIGDTLGILGSLVGDRHDLGGGVDQPAEQSQLVHDLGVVARRRRRRDLLHELVDAERAADVLEGAPALELLHGRDLVRGLAAAVEVDQRLEDDPMGGSVEVIRLDLLDDLGDRLG